MRYTYESFRELGREAHLVAGLCLVVEVGAPQQEGKHCVQETVDSVVCVFADRHQHLVEACLECWVDSLCHLFVCLSVE